MDPQPQQFAAFCHYPPKLAPEVDITERVDPDGTRYIVRNTATSRYFILKQTEFNILNQFDGVQAVPDVAGGLSLGTNPHAAIPTLVRFLTKLDSFGLLARGGSENAVSTHHSARGLYIKFRLFNPDKFLASLDKLVGWALTKSSIVISFGLMALVAFLMFTRATEVSAYTSYLYREYGISVILLVTLTITALHEFAHGLACKHFGGDVREMGVLLIYYVLPGFYCNVTDIYRIGRKSQRLWVIFAGIYWQLVVSTLGGLCWLVSTPYTLFADLALLVFIGGSFNILINCNPLIKLDGYYALSQALGVVNLQRRSSEYVGSLIARIVGEPSGRIDPHRPMLYVSYWICSILYSVILIWLILGWISGELMDGLRFLGVLLTILLALLLTERWWKPILIKLSGSIIALPKHFSFAQPASRVDGVSSMPTQQIDNKVSETNTGDHKGSKRLPRRQVIKIGLALILLAVLIAPWEAATGSDCTLLLPPEREGVVRANTDAVLAEVYVQPGDAVADGAKVARLSNPEIEDRLTQLTSEIERLNTNNSRIEEELRVRSENVLSANFKESDRKRIESELKDESAQIANVEQGPASKQSQALLPPSLTILQSEIELKQIELEHNRKEVDRYKKLLEQGLVGEQMYDRAVAEAKLSDAGLRTARARLDAALVDHRRLTTGAQTNSLVAETEARAARSTFEALIAELHSNRQQLESLRQRHEILKRESEGMAIMAPKSGVVLGDDLRKMVGRRYSRGEEICRIGEIGKFLLKIDVSEREIGSVRLDSPVRFKLKTVPGRVFTGRVSKINAESIPNQYAQRFYPVEVLIDNADGLLRPGMTGFARISFGKQSIGLILADKVWQALRPELWLF